MHHQIIETKWRRAARKKVKAKKTKPPASAAYNGRLKPLVEFLNLDIDQARGNCEGANISTDLNLLIFRDSRENRKAVREELIEVLSPITALPWPRPFRTRKRMQDHLDFLIDRIHRLKFEPRFIPLAGEKKLFGLPNPARRLRHGEQGIFSRGAGRGAGEWIVKMEFSTGIGASSRANFYGLIAEGLITGELAKLRRCPLCQTFFVAREARIQFCIPEHGRQFYDHPTLAKERVELSRSQNKNRELN